MSLQGSADEVRAAPLLGRTFWLVPLPVLAFMVCQFVGWTLAPALTHISVPLDVAEGYAWGREWVIATYKHPALPSWLLEGSRVLTGAIGWPAYVISQLFVVATFLIVYTLGNDLLGRRRAIAGTLLLAGVAFFAWPTVEFNHNIAKLPMAAALPLTLWRAVERRSLSWWLLFGITAGIGLYAKLSTLLLLAILALWMLWDAKARAQILTLGPWLAAATTILISLPLLDWLVRHNFAPLAYAAARTHEASAGYPQFFADVALNVAGLFALMAIAGLLLRKSAPAPADGGDQKPDARIVSFLAIITLGPLMVATTGALLTGSGLKASWGNSMLSYAGMFAVAGLNLRVTDDAIRRLAIAAIAITIVTPLAYGVAVVVDPRKSAPTRVNWPQAEISRRMVEIWERETKAPLRIVAGYFWVPDIITL
ncbi:MAG: glycosyltransferase family 39 protein, partial [Hyphomicrobium sp.]|nr:glycosyltransferase family 39 protein [Hyphomicrobium sp.]